MNNEQMEKREEEAEPLNQMFQTENSESKIHFSWQIFKILKIWIPRSDLSKNHRFLVKKG